jgi:hypothetical protein
MITWSGTTSMDTELVDWLKPRYGSGLALEHVIVMHVTRLEASVPTGEAQPTLPVTKRRWRSDMLIPHHKGDRVHVLVYVERPANEVPVKRLVHRGV